ncbi:transporter substrate-binding domain-containing protein [Granulosicoccus antarcticus]|uniref:Lysine/arginine/ornithine-binding periplasmic protein n=1 Tax=Granulosicoccus antarcticus IMCC3135 TaxID=1192854 RepID=A0A2Z2NMN2_9GAMM|nr:transporter substrate-binding domain-containing protein [Granulosicoccus antarcticus]ASJ72479.1 Lysine/arginine/ornithine-binding periplasmic protein [Granulosicoccus antarcticus IMCC3135]
MKKLFVSLATVMLGFVGSPVMAELRLGLDSAPYPPFYQTDSNGNLVGWEVEIGDALCAAMQEECVWVPVAWDGLIPALLAKKIDGILGSMSITAEREKTISFSDKYYNTPSAIVALKTSSISDSPESVKGKIIGVQVATTNQNYVQKYLEDSADSIKIYQDFNEHNQDLIAGRIDAAVGDSLAFEAFLNSAEGEQFEVKSLLSDDIVFGPGIGVGLRKGDDELEERFNNAIKQIREDGTYETISASYFDFNIFGE